MDANLKLLKKRRVAHTGSKLPNVSYEEPKLPPDDFVFNIMKDMDKKMKGMDKNKNVVSYQQLQEFKSQNRQDSSLTEDNCSYHRSFHSKQTKKMLPKRIFPLMKKCQTSLKHLKKNRCIPKPRAHVGYVPKPQFKPIVVVEKNTTQFQDSGSSKISKTKSNSKSRSTTSQPDFKVYKTSKLKNHANKETVKDKAQVEDKLSSSDDDAFESFVSVQKATEYSSDSSDSDTSCLIIHRKRSKTKSKQMKKKSKDLSSDNKVNRHFPKITSRPLSDSSESEAQETLAVENKGVSFKRCKYSEHELPTQLQQNFKENIPDEVAYNSNLSEEDPQDLGDLNYDSSDSESNFEAPRSGLLSITQSRPVDHTELKRCKNFKEKKVAHSAVNVDLSSINFESTSSHLVSSEPTKSVPKCDIPCYVRIIRDPVLDKEAMSVCTATPIISTSNTFHSSDDDCIIVSENSDNEEMPEVPKSQTDSLSAIWESEDTEPDDCVIMCEMPKQVLDSQRKQSNATNDSSSSKAPLPNIPKTNTEVQIHKPDEINNLSNSKNSNQIGPITSVKDTLNRQSLQTEADMDECVVVCEKSKPDAPGKIPESSHSSISEKIANPNFSSQATNELPPIEHNEDNTIDSEIQDFNVKIVDVHSLTELDGSLIQPNAPESHYVEVIDLSDDNLQVSDIREKSNAEKKIVDNNESAAKDNGSNLSIKCEPNIDILETLSKIDFDCIKEVISKTKQENSSIGSSKIDGSTCSNLLLPGNSIPMPIYNKAIIDKEINSTNIIRFQEQNSKLDDSFELPSVKTGPQVRNENEFPVKLTGSQLVEPAKSIAPKCTMNEIYFNSKNLSSVEGRTDTNVSGKLPIYSKQNSENIQISRDALCKSLKSPEFLNKATAKNYQDSNTVVKTATPQMTISNQGKVNAPDQADNQSKISEVRNEKDIQNLRVIQPVKKEIMIESPSDELDVLAASYINDLKPSNKKVLSLLDLYKIEYEKYRQIKNTETNVSAGLKLLHDNQVKKLAHLRASIKNLAQHDPCFYKVNQEASCVSVKTSMKNVPMVKMDAKRQNPEVSKEFKREGPPLPEKGVQVTTKFDTAGPSRENFFRLMMNIKCAQCGKPATARCQGCAEIYYCSPRCGEQSWRQGHFAVCKKS